MERLNLEALEPLAPVLARSFSGLLTPGECCDCPYATADPDEDPPNPADRGEGLYLCNLLGEEEVRARNDIPGSWNRRHRAVWGENPLCTPADWLPVLQAEVEALGKLATLHPAERGFYEALLAAPHDRDLALIFGDWLEEQQRPAGAESVRRLKPGSGDVIVMQLSAEHDAATREAIMRQTKAVWPDNFCVVLPPSFSLETVPQKPGDIMVVRLLHGITDESLERLRRDCEALSHAAFPHNKFVILRQGESLATLSDYELRQAGLVRSGSDEQRLRHALVVVDRLLGPAGEMTVDACGRIAALVREALRQDAAQADKVMRRALGGGT